MKLFFTPYIYTLFSLLIFSSVCGQEYQLKLSATQQINNDILKKIYFQKKHLDKKSVYKEIDSTIYKLELKGYIMAKVDTVFKTDSLFDVQFNFGPRTKNIRIQYKNLPTQYLSKKTLNKISSSVTNNYFEIKFTEIPVTMQYIADHLENSGFSFTEISLVNIRLTTGIAYADIKTNIRNQRTIDKVIIKGYSNFPKNFISNELNLKIGTRFNKSKLQYASNIINKMIFVEEQKPPEVLFTKDSTFIYLYLNKKQSNKFDGVIGFSSKENESGIEFNGYLDMAFNNIFNNGETIALFWKNNGNDSQRFNIGAEIPYIFNLPIIPKINFELFRKDTTFNNTQTKFDLIYALNNKGNISASLLTENSNNLIKDQNTSIQSFKNIFYGVQYNYEKLTNDNLFPVHFKIDLNAYLGNRKTEQDKIDQSKFKLLVNYQWTIDNKNYIFIQNRSGLLNSENYFENELFRLGGTNDIRGVNEESIFASTYSIFNLEYRFRASISSYFFTITDFSFIDNKTIQKSATIYSLGLGYAFTTKLGILNMSYAVGKFDNNPFQFNNSKIHIKVISFF